MRERIWDRSWRSAGVSIGLALKSAADSCSSEFCSYRRSRASSARERERESRESREIAKHARQVLADTERFSLRAHGNYSNG